MPLRTITSLGALYALFSSWPHALAGVLVLVVISVAATVFVRWFVALTPARRRDVLRLIEILRRR